MIKKYPPNNFYKLKTTGQRVVLHSYDENETVQVHVLAAFNPETMINTDLLDRTVFGIKPSNLEECDGPAGYIAETI